MDPKKLAEIVKPKKISQHEKEARLKQLGLPAGSTGPKLPSTGSGRNPTSFDQTAKSVYMKVASGSSGHHINRSQNNTPKGFRSSFNNVTSTKPANFGSLEPPKRSGSGLRIT